MSTFSTSTSSCYEEAYAMGLKKRIKSMACNEKGAFQEEESTLLESVSSSQLLLLDNYSKKEPLYSAEKSEEEKDSKSSFFHSSPACFSTRQYALLVFLFTVAALCTRWYRIGAGNFVLWDEAHFGKFGSYYLKRSYYTDVHPPLAKMIVGLAEYLAGFDGKSFKFESAKTYPPSVNYVGMRMFLSGIGAMIVPLLFASAFHLGLSKNACLLTGITALFDVGLIGICRPILLDSSLLFFTALTCLFLVKHIRERYSPFGLKWCMNLCALGMSIGFAASCKWVGLFSVALVGLFTIWELIWRIWADKRNSYGRFAAHFAVRALFLIVVPVSIYCLTFWVHFRILNRSGPGDGQMSALFQASLKDSKVARSPLSVVYGSTVAIKSKSRFTGNLHSHIQRYPNGSGQQQITIYHHRDANNYWVITKASNEEAVSSTKENSPNDDELLEPVRNGDRIRLTHSTTMARLHSHRLRSFITTSDFEVSGYGNPSIQDPNDEWIVEFVGANSAQRHSNGKGQSLQTLFTNFRLKHANLGCYLRYTTKHYPDWGFKQGEVTCSLAPDSGREAIWSIEENIHSRLPAPEEGCYKSSFWDDFIDLNVNMYRSNNSLTPDPDVHPTGLTSSPKEWPFLIRGIRMSAWEDDKVRFYMFVNPTSGWMCLVALCGSCAILAVRFLAWQRNGTSIPQQLRTCLPKLSIGLAGWSLHYFTFFIMGRVLYFHHYYPAYLFGILNMAVMFDYAMETGSGTSFALWKKRLFLAYVIMTIVVYCMFSPIAYGMEGKVSDYWYLKWLPKWM